MVQVFTSFLLLILICMTAVLINISSSLRLTSRQVIDNIHLYPPRFTNLKNTEGNQHSQAYTAERSAIYTKVSGCRLPSPLKSLPGECTMASNKSD